MGKGSGADGKTRPPVDFNSTIITDTIELTIIPRKGDEALTACGEEATDDDLRELLTANFETLKIMRDEQVNRNNHYPSRRGIEQVMAFYYGKEHNDFGEDNKTKTYRELFLDMQELEKKGMNLRLQDMACRIEGQLLDGLAGELEASEELCAKFPDAWSSSDLDDYSRADLLKILKYKKVEAEGFSDEQLRGLAVENGMVPKNKDYASPATVKSVYALSHYRYPAPEYVKRGFTQANKNTYDRNITGMFFSKDDDVESLHFALKLAEKYPVMQKNIYDLKENIRNNPEIAENNGLSIGDRENRADKSDLPIFQNAFTLKNKQALDNFSSSFGVKNRVEAMQPNLTFTDANGRKRRHNAGGFWNDSSKQMNIHANTVSNLEKARKGKATPRQIGAVSGVFAHETFHAMSPHDDPQGRPGTETFILSEGMTESMARIHKEKMANELGIVPAGGFSAEEKQAYLESDYAYNSEVETVTTLFAITEKEFSPEKAKEGFYKNPRNLSKQAQEKLEKTYLNKKLSDVSAYFKTNLKALPDYSDDIENSMVQGVYKHMRG